MSVCVTTDAVLSALCVKTLALHGNPARGGFAGVKIAGLFQAIRIAQHAAYAVSYEQGITLSAMEFPTSAPPQMLNTRALKDLYVALITVGASTFDRNGHGWLPEGWARLLNAVRTRTATRAAGF